MNDRLSPARLRCCGERHLSGHGGYADFARFFRSWMRNPLRVAAVAPSSTSLAQIMTSEIGADTGRVLELGPGTGVFTRALLARGIDEADLTLVEYGPEFIGQLKERFPSARVVQMDAARLARVPEIRQEPFGAVVSGLPLLSMSPRKTASILSGAFSLMRSGGSFYQFTYGPRCPVPRPILDRLGLKAARLGGTVFNVPPAAVYRITRRSAPALQRLVR